jgi:hypothetical protein
VLRQQLHSLTEGNGKKMCRNHCFMEIHLNIS